MAKKKKKKKGKPLPGSNQMRMWKKQYEKMSLEDHKKKLKDLGLEDEDLEGFGEAWKQEKEESKKKSK